MVELLLVEILGHNLMTAKLLRCRHDLRIVELDAVLIPDRGGVADDVHRDFRRQKRIKERDPLVQLIQMGNALLENHIDEFAHHLRGDQPVMILLKRMGDKLNGGRLFLGIGRINRIDKDIG